MRSPWNWETKIGGALIAALMALAAAWVLFGSAS
jgi:hypothetical protein